MRRCPLSGNQFAQRGQYILTSATPNHKGILHSGAGRIGKLCMRPMSLYESGDSSGTVSLEKLCRGELTPSMTGEVDLRKLIDLIIRGRMARQHFDSHRAGSTASCGIFERGH